MNLTAILGILLAVAVAAAGLMGKLYVGAEKKFAAEEQAYKSFRAQVKVLGEEAKAKAAAQAMSDKLRKDTADAENAATVARLNASITSLRRERDSRSSGGVLPPAPAGSVCPPEQACFERAGLESALRELTAGVRGLADEGTALEADLNTARAWARSSAP